jgi:glycosyltransferase involved in cell wall biosynthesis
MLKPSALSIKRRKKNLWLQFLKVSGIADRIIFHATSELEADEVRAVFGNTAKIQIAPNIPCMPVERLPAAVKQAGKLRLSLAGRVHPIKNLLYLLRLLKAVSFECSLNVIGPIEDIDYERECRDMISTLPDNITVEFSGAVTNEDVVRLIADSDFMVLPTLGENFGHTIFEALSLGVPVLISDQTYWRDLEADHAGWDIDLSQPDRFRVALEMMGHMDNIEYQRWQHGAHQRAIRFFEQNDLKAAYLDLLSPKLAIAGDR